MPCKLPLAKPTYVACNDIIIMSFCKNILCNEGLYTAVESQFVGLCVLLLLLYTLYFIFPTAGY